MTLPDLDGRRLHSRIRGRAALERRLRGLLIAVHRFARGRAVTPADHHWCAEAIDGLTALLSTAPAPRERGLSDNGISDTGARTL